VAILLPFFFLTTTCCFIVFFFTISWPSPFSLSIIFHSTKRHLETTYLLHINPLKVELTLKMVVPLPTLVTNDYLPSYIWPIPQNFPLYTFTNVKVSRFNSLNCPKLCCSNFLSRMSN
jgi:hypothetical protein